MPAKHIYWILVVAVLSLFSVWCADPYAGTFRYVVRKIRSHAIRPLSERELFDASISGLIASVDENSSYIQPKTYGDLNEEFHQESGSTGILFYQEPISRKICVGATLPRSSARLAGVLPGDELLAMDGVSFEKLSFEEVCAQLNSPTGVEVSLDVFRPSSQKKLTFPLTSRKLPIESVTGVARSANGSWNYFLPPLPSPLQSNDSAKAAAGTNAQAAPRVNPKSVSEQTPPAPTAAGKAGSPKIVYARLETFGERTVEEMRQILKSGRQAQADGLILDLRGNGGGLLESALGVCGLFLPTNVPVVRIMGPNDSKAEPLCSPEKQVWEKPIVILMDGETASASEILAVCLQDYGEQGLIRAICVGSRTYGKGTIQDIFDMGPIPDDRRLASEEDPKTLWQKIWTRPMRGGFRISVAEYLSPSLKRIHRFPNASDADEWGVRPNPGWEVPWSSNPLWQKDRKKFQTEWWNFNDLRRCGALPQNRWEEIYGFDLPLRQAVRFFY